MFKFTKNAEQNQAEGISDDQLVENIKKKMLEIPLMRDIVEHLCSLEISEGKTANIVITTRDFRKFENVTFEKLLK